MRPALCALLLAGALAFPAGAQLPAPVARSLAAAGFAPDALGAVVSRLSDGATVLAHNADRAMQPASALKLLTSWVALETLGPGWKGSTELRHDGRLERGVLRGNLYLRGMGDVDFDWRELERLLRMARLQGIREIRGDVVLDRSWFTPARTDQGLRPFDEAPEFRYNVVPDALLLNTNLLEIDLWADGKQVRASMSPPLEGVTLRADMALVDRACADWEDGWRHPMLVEHVRGPIELRLLGEFPRDCSASTAINAIDRTVFAERLFRSLWRGLGGTLRGTVREGAAPGDTRLIAHHLSRPLAEVVRDINVASDNPITRVVYLALGATGPGGAPTTAAAAEARVRAFLAGHGIASDGLVLENGSGLSRVERIPARQLAAILRAARASPWSPEFMASIPVVAVDRSLSRRLKDSPAMERARIKTGTLRDASAVAGYVTSVAGEEYVVAAMVNDPRAESRVARPVLDALLDWVARGPAGNSP